MVGGDSPLPGPPWQVLGHEVSTALRLTVPVKELRLARLTVSLTCDLVFIV